jgi:nitroreductase
MGMSTQELNQETLQEAIEKAGRAPSIHNSQPWRFRVGERRVDLYADPTRWLPATDADGRDLLLSCGAALHHLRLALADAGLHATVHRLPAVEEPNHLATVELDAGSGPDAPATELLSAIPDRRTDRRPFTHWPIPEAFVRQLIERAAEQGAVLRVVSDAGTTDVLMKAIETAASAQDDLPGYQAELRSWTGREGDDGIPLANLPRNPTTRVEAARTFEEGAIETAETGQPEALTLMVLGTASDDRLSQLRAGEALSAVLLQATRFGLATSPLSQPLEIGATRQVLQDDVLDGTLSPQIVLRIGWAPADAPLPPTPRRPVAQIIDPLPH